MVCSVVNGFKILKLKFLKQQQKKLATAFWLFPLVPNPTECNLLSLSTEQVRMYLSY